MRAASAPTVVSLGASIVIISGIASLLSMLRVWQPKGKEHGFFGTVAKPLPSDVLLFVLQFQPFLLRCNSIINPHR